MMRLLLIFFLIPNPAILENKELAEEFHRQTQCLSRRSRHISLHQEHVQVIVLTKGSDIILPCFPCVAPEDAVEIETTFKPSSGSIGRVFKKAVDFFKKRLSPSSTLFDEKKWKYDWEFANSGKAWVDLTNIHQRKQKLDAIGEKISRFLNRDSNRLTLGDRYELNLKNVNANQTGFYRCINKYKKVHRITMTYFLDIQSKSDLKMVYKMPSNTTEIQKVLSLFPNKKLKDEQLIIRHHTHSWNRCNKCGSNTTGEQTRLHECVIESSLKFLDKQPDSSKWIRLFGKVPCESSVVPLRLRKLIGKFPKIVEFRSCNATCISPDIQDRTISTVDELGEFRVLDYIPKGEFLFGEILPQLLPPVVRKGYLVIEGDPIVFSCNVNPYESTAVHWHSDKSLNIGYNYINNEYKGRIHFDEVSRLIFTKVEMSDAGFYYCYNSENILIGAHNLMVAENERTKEILANMEMLLRFIAFTLICIMIISRLLE